MVKVDIEMPSNCIECRMWDEDSDICILQRYCGRSIASYVNQGYGRPEWCQLEDAESIEPKHTVAGIFCGNCDSYIRTCDSFCASCGRKIKWTEDRRTGE